jgi:hypothetical protein
MIFFLHKQKSTFRGGAASGGVALHSDFVLFIFFVSWVTRSHRCDGHLRVDLVDLMHPWSALLCNAFVEN